MKKTILVIISILFIQNTFAQNTEKAKKLLDDVSKTFASYKNVSLVFEYSLDNDKESVHQKTSGQIIVQGDKYQLNFMGNEYISDGKKVYTIVHEDEEVYISAPNPNEDDFTPTKLLSFYKKGHQYTWGKLETVNGKKIQYIKLVPIKSGDISYIMLGIDIQTNHIYSVAYYDKKNTKVTFKIREFKPNVVLSSKEFVFDQAKYTEKNYSITEL